MDVLALSTVGVFSVNGEKGSTLALSTAGHFIGSVVQIIIDFIRGSIALMSYEMEIELQGKR